MYVQFTSCVYRVINVEPVNRYDIADPAFKDRCVDQKIKKLDIQKDKLLQDQNYRDFYLFFEQYTLANK